MELWERLLAYGAALGVAPAAIRPIPMGAEPENRAWSTYGGRWHQVDVRFRHGPQWGQHPGWALLSRLALTAFGLFFLWIAGTVLVDALDDADGIARLILIGAIAVPVALAVMGALLALRAASDLVKSTEVTGEIVRLRTTQSEGEKTGHWVAVDDGTSKEVRAWSVRPEIYAGLEQGQIVTVRVTPRLGYVHSIDAGTRVRPRVFVTRRVPALVREELERSFALDVHDEELPPPREDLLARVVGCNGLVTMLTDRVDAEPSTPPAAAPHRRELRSRPRQCRPRGVPRREIVVSNTPEVLTMPPPR